MYGVVHSFPLDMKKTFENELNQSYNAPLPYLTNLEPQSAYLKDVSVSCDGCGVRILSNLSKCLLDPDSRSS